MQLMAGAMVLIGVGFVLSRLFDESMTDALLLRAKFGFMVADTGVHSYGWCFVFGYTLLFANVLLLATGSFLKLFRMARSRRRAA